jgi:hypothetical protein
MAASRTARATSRRRTARKAGAKRPAKKVVKPVRVVVVPQQTMYRLCKAGWSVIVDKVPNAQGTRFVCPFCPYSHRVPGPVRGFRKVRRAQWIKLRRVAE